jgi:hypothetical protein
MFYLRIYCRTSVVLEWLVFLLLFREVPRSNLDLETGYPEDFPAFLIHT